MSNSQSSTGSSGDPIIITDLRDIPTVPPEEPVIVRRDPNRTPWRRRIRPQRVPTERAPLVVIRTNEELKSDWHCLICLDHCQTCENSCECGSSTRDVAYFACCNTFFHATCIDAYAATLQQGMRCPHCKRRSILSSEFTHNEPPSALSSQSGNVTFASLVTRDIPRVRARNVRNRRRRRSREQSSSSAPATRSTTRRRLNSSEPRQSSSSRRTRSRGEQQVDAANAANAIANLASSSPSPSSDVFGDTVEERKAFLQVVNARLNQLIRINHTTVTPLLRHGFTTSTAFTLFLTRDTLTRQQFSATLHLATTLMDQALRRQPTTMTERDSSRLASAVNAFVALLSHFDMPLNWASNIDTNPSSDVD